MKWLHLSDFHIGRENVPEAEAMASLIDAIRSVTGEGGESVDAVFLVGDIAFSGQADQYARFVEIFLALSFLNIRTRCSCCVYDGSH